jgi:hypothetical protein
MMDSIEGDIAKISEVQSHISDLAVKIELSTAFGCYRGIADIDQAAPIKLWFMGTRPKLPEADPIRAKLSRRAAQARTGPVIPLRSCAPSPTREA